MERNFNFPSKIRSYLSYTSKMYRSVLFLLAPLACILLIMIPPMRSSYLILMIVACVIVMYTEMIMDQMFMGGFLENDTVIPKYIKSSASGKSYIYTVFAANMIRQFIEICLIAVMLRILFCIITNTPLFDAEDLPIGFGAALAMYTLIQIGLDINRHFSGMMPLVIILSVQCILFSLWVAASSANPVVTLIIDVFLVLGATFVAFCDFDSKIGDGYYD